MLRYINLKGAFSNMRHQNVLLCIFWAGGKATPSGGGSKWAPRAVRGLSPPRAVRGLTTRLGPSEALDSPPSPSSPSPSPTPPHPLISSNSSPPWRQISRRSLVRLSSLSSRWRSSGRRSMSSTSMETEPSPARWAGGSVVSCLFWHYNKICGVVQFWPQLMSCVILCRAHGSEIFWAEPSVPLWLISNQD